jgi:isopentenyldiphosphate isomerase
MPLPHPDDGELLIQVSDDDSRIIGPVERRFVHGNPAIIHRAVHIVILNDEGLMLLQKRAAAKYIMPGRWDTSVGGHVDYGESYEEAAHREAEEELGVPLADLEYLYFLPVRDSVESENIRSYFCRHSGPFHPNPEEVEELRFWNRKQVETAVGAGDLTPNFEIEFAAFLASPRAGLLR